MKNSDSQTCALATAVQSTPEAGDPLLDRWLASPPARRPTSSRPPPREPQALDPLGDDVADAWFR